MGFSGGTMHRSRWFPIVCSATFSVVVLPGCSEDSSSRDRDEDEDKDDEDKDDEDKDDEDETDQPKVDRELDDQVFFVSASSVVKDFEGYSFAAHQLLDDDLETCWQESNHKSKGEGEYVTVYFLKPVDISQIRIANGCQNVSGKYGDLYEKNSRPSTLQLISDGGATASISLPDSRDWHAEKVQLKSVSHLTLQIGDVHRGLKWQDASISELSFVGQLSDEPAKGSIAPGLAAADQDTRTTDMAKSSKAAVGSSQETLHACDKENEVWECLGRVTRQAWRSSLDLEELSKNLPRSCTLDSLGSSLGYSTSQSIRVGALASREDLRLVYDVRPMVGQGVFYTEQLEYGTEAPGSDWTHQGAVMNLAGSNANLENAWKIAYACTDVQELVDRDIAALPKRNMENEPFDDDSIDYDDPDFDWDGPACTEWTIKRGSEDGEEYVTVSRVQGCGLSSSSWVNVWVDSNRVLISTGSGT
jgi:hypothetical protein